jgi:FG-GAP repeat
VAAATAAAGEVARADFDDDGFVDLAIGVPGEDPGNATSTRDAGEVVVLFGQAGGLTMAGEEYFANADVGDGILLHGTAGGLSGAGSQSLTLEVSNVGSNEAGDRFGSALGPGPPGS